MSQVILFHKGGREDRRALVAAGEAPRDFFYGFLAAERDGFDIEWESTAEDYPESGGSVRRLMERAHSSLTGAAWRPYALDRMGARLMDASVAISVTDHFSLTLGRWGAAHRRRPHLVGLFHGLSDIENRVSPRGRAYVRWYIRRAASGLDRMGFFGDADRRWSIEHYGLPAERTFVFGFGVDSDFWSPGPARAEEPRVLAVGSDLNRDYEILLRAPIEGKLRLVTRLPLVVPPGRQGVELLRGSFDKVAITDTVLRDFYRSARCVVVAMHDCWQPSGYSVTLQALSCGVPVVLTSIKGLWAPELLRDGENCLLVPPGDAAAIGTAVQRITQDTALAQRLAAAGRETVLKHFSLGVGERAARDLLAHVPDLRPAKTGTA